MKTTNKQTSETFPLSGITAGALKNYEQAVRSGLKLQQESWQWWSGMFDRAAGTEDWEKKLNKLNGIANELVPLVQERLDDAMTIIESNARIGTELMKQAIDASQTLAIAVDWRFQRDARCHWRGTAYAYCVRHLADRGQ